jgi:hypothetical protein
LCPRRAAPKPPMSQISLAEDELSTIWALGSQFCFFADKSFPLQALLR